MPTTETRRLPKAKRPAPQTRARVEAGRKKRPAASYAQSGPRRPSVMPSWKDLTSGRNERGFGKPVRFLAPISTLRFIAIVLVVAAAFTVYVGHVHATQDLYTELQRMRRENLRMHLKYNRLNGEFDQATGPAFIYERARPLGLVEGYAFGPVIRLEQ
jgi:hypothetical protein